MPDICPLTTSAISSVRQFDYVFDIQIKLHGHRFELGEIESVLKQTSGTSRVVAAGWPVTPAGVDGIVAFLECDVIDKSALTRAAQQSLPPYTSSPWRVMQMKVA